jgi:photosystem II stability/assembly factor-like uncharacterized protein
VPALALNPTTPNRLYAGTYWGGVFRSTDSGDNWVAINEGLTNPTIHALAIDPLTSRRAYAGTREGVFRSTDGGASWISAGLTNLSVYALAINPLSSNTLYAGTGDGVFRSADGGNNWVAVSTGLPQRPVQALAVDPVTPSRLYASTVGGGGGLFRSTNRGYSWTALNIGLDGSEVLSIVIDPVTPTTLYVSGMGVFRSTDAGEGWVESSAGLPDLIAPALAIDPVTPTTLYVGTRAGLFRSTDSGDSWVAVNSGLTDLSIRALAIDPATPTTLYAGTWDGVFRSTGSGENWEGFNAGLTNSFVQVLAIDPLDPSTVLVGTASNLFRSISYQLSSASALAGSQITLTGGGFETGQVSVFFNGITAEVMVMDKNTLLVTVPSGLFGPAEVALATMPGGTATVSTPFVVKTGATAVFPWFLNGKSGASQNRTRIILRNNSDQAATGIILFKDGNGNPIQLSIEGGLLSQSEFSLNPFGVLDLETDGTGELQTGVIEIVQESGNPQKLKVTLVFSILGHFVSVDRNPVRQRHQVYVSVVPGGAGENTGLALYNPDPEQMAMVEMILVDEQGMQCAAREVILDPMQQLVAFVNEEEFFKFFFEDSPPPFQGTLNLRVTEGHPVAVTGLIQKNANGAVIATSTSPNVFLPD